MFVSVRIGPERMRKILGSLKRAVLWRLIKKCGEAGAHRNGFFRGASSVPGRRILG